MRKAEKDILALLSTIASTQGEILMILSRTQNAETQASLRPLLESVMTAIHVMNCRANEPRELSRRADTPKSTGMSKNSESQTETGDRLLNAN